MSGLREVAIQVAPELFNAVPIQEAMSGLFVQRPDAAAIPHVALAVCQLRVARHPELVAGLWLYADDLEACHRIVQDLKSPAADWWHAIMHRREGDAANAAYWYRQAARHPLWRSWSETTDANLLSSVNLDTGSSTELINAQRTEWSLLFSWCAGNLA